MSTNIRKTIPTSISVLRLQVRNTIDLLIQNKVAAATESKDLRFLFRCVPDLNATARRGTESN